MVDPEPARQPPSPPTGQVIGAVAVGGVVGALARYQIGRCWPTPLDGFPFATLFINLLGCLVIGTLLVMITELVNPHPLARPLLGTGVLGGFTTFSTYALDIHLLLTHGRVGTALAYLAITALGAVAATAAGMTLARRLLPRRAA